MSVTLAGGLAESTTASYSSGHNAWHNFCRRGGFPHLLHKSVVPDPLDAELVMLLFCSHLDMLGLDAETVCSYASAVRSLHVDSMGSVPWEPGHRLKRLKRSLRRAKRRRGGVEKRAPITRRILLQWRRWFDLSKAQHVIWWTAMLVAFFGLFRKSEFTLPDGTRFDPLVHLTRADCVFVRDSRGKLLAVDLHVKFYKNEQLGSSTAVPLAYTGDVLCVATMLELLYNLFCHLPSTAPLFPGGPGFTDALRGGEFAKVLARCVAATPELVGVKLLPHSFRIGGAMALFEAGAPDSVIMMMGRWRSDAFRAYLRSSRSTILFWNQKVVDGSTSTNGRVFGVDQAEAALHTLRVQSETAFTATSYALGVVSGRSSTLMTSAIFRPAPSLVFPQYSW
jgi:hypothetical protein